MTSTRDASAGAEAGRRRQRKGPMGGERCDGKDPDAAVEIALVVLFVVLAALAWAWLGCLVPLGG